MRQHSTSLQPGRYQGLKRSSGSEKGSPSDSSTAVLVGSGAVLVSSVVSEVLVSSVVSEVLVSSVVSEVVSDPSDQSYVLSLNGSLVSMLSVDGPNQPRRVDSMPPAEVLTTPLLLTEAAPTTAVLPSSPCSMTRAPTRPPGVTAPPGLTRT